MYNWPVRMPAVAGKYHPYLRAKLLAHVEHGPYIWMLGCVDAVVPRKGLDGSSIIFTCPFAPRIKYITQEDPRHRCVLEFECLVLADDTWFEVHTAAEWNKHTGEWFPLLLLISTGTITDLDG